MKTLRMLAPIALAATALLAGCSGANPAPAAAPAATTPPATAAAPSPSATPAPSTSDSASPAASLPGPDIDDYNGDGTPDPTCGTQDFGAGLKLRIPCNLGGYAHTPEDGTVLVKNSLYRLPGPDFDLTGISGEMLGIRDTAGHRVFILISNSDGLFATGSAAITSPGDFDAIIRLIGKVFPGSTIQVRGHTDATGTTAGNNVLSQHRADAVRQYFLSHHVDAAAVTAAGLGSTQPLVVEKDAKGRAFNRRVEIVIRPAQ